MTDSNRIGFDDIVDSAGILAGLKAMIVKMQAEVKTQAGATGASIKANPLSSSGDLKKFNTDTEKANQLLISNNNLAVEKIKNENLLLAAANKKAAAEQKAEAAAEKQAQKERLLIENLKLETNSIEKLRLQTNAMTSQRDKMIVKTAEEAAARQKLTNQIKANTDQLKAHDLEVGKGQRSVGLYGEALAGMKSQFGTIFTAAGLAGLAVNTISQAFSSGKQFVIDSVKAYEEVIKSERVLLFAMDGRADITNRMINSAKELQYVSGVDDETIKSQMAFLAIQGRSEAQIKKTIQAALDFSAATGEDFVSAVKKFDGTMNGVLGKLKKYDASLKELTPAQLAAGAAIDILGKKFSGVAEKSVTLSKKLGIVFHEMKESVGGAIYKAITPIVLLTEKIKDLTREDLADYNDSVASSFVDMTDTVNKNSSEINTLVARYESLKSVAKPNKEQQDELNTVMEKIVAIVPQAADEIDNYGKVLSINTTYAKGFVEQQQIILKTLSGKTANQLISDLSNTSQQIKQLQTDLRIGTENFFGIYTQMSDDEKSKTAVLINNLEARKDITLKLLYDSGVKENEVVRYFAKEINGFKLSDYATQIDALRSFYAKMDKIKKDANKPPPAEEELGLIEKKRAQITALTAEIESAKTTAEIKTKQAQLIILQKELDTLLGKKDTEKLKETKKSEYDLWKLRIDAMEEGTAKLMAEEGKRYLEEKEKLEASNTFILLSTEERNAALENLSTIHNTNSEKITSDANKKKLEAEKTYQDKLAEIENTEYLAGLSTQNAEIVAVMQKYEKLIAEAEQYGVDTTNLKKKETDEINKIITDAAKKDADDLKKINDDAAAKKKEADKDLIDAAVETTNAIIESYVKRSEAKQANLDKELEASKKYEDQMRELAKTGIEGATENLAFEQKKQAEIETKKLREEKKQKRLELRMAAISAFGKIAETDPEKALTKTITEITKLLAFINTIPEFAEGIIAFGGKHKEAQPDDTIVKIGKGESVMTAKATYQYQAQLEAMQALRYNPMDYINIPKDGTQKNLSDYGVIKEIQVLNETLKNKTEYSIDINGLTHEIIERVQRGNTIVINNHKPKGLF